MVSYMTGVPSFTGLFILNDVRKGCHFGRLVGVLSLISGSLYCIMAYSWGRDSG